MSQRTEVRVSAIASCFRGERYLRAFLENCATQTLAGEFEVVLVLNDPSAAESELVRDFETRHRGLVTPLVVEREPLAVSTNRALKAARGEYVCIWNVDDLRTPESLELMADTLDTAHSAGFTYGDYLTVDRWQKTDGPRVTAPRFDRRSFVRSMHAGPFYMWRRELCDQIGLWDEQLKMGGDFDFAVRLALAADGQKTDGLLGYYLDEGSGLSTGATPLQPTERTLIELRYGIYDKVDIAFVRAARRYRLHELRQDGDWIPLGQLAPNFRDYARSKLWLLLAGPRWAYARTHRLTRAWLHRVRPQVA